MSRFVEFTGQRFGRLVVKRRAPNMGPHVAWLCICDCGNAREVRATSLRVGNTTSCGCVRRSVAQERMRRYHLRRAGLKRYRPVDEVLAEVFRDPLGRLAEYARAALRWVSPS